MSCNTLCLQSLSYEGVCRLHSMRHMNNTLPPRVKLKCVLVPTLPAHATHPPWPMPPTPTPHRHNWGLCTSASVHSEVVAFWLFDVASSYHCEAEFTKCEQFLPLRGIAQQEMSFLNLHQHSQLLKQSIW